MKQRILRHWTKKVIPYSGNEPSTSCEAIELEGKDAFWWESDYPILEIYEYNAQRKEWSYTGEDVRGVLN